MSIMYFSGAAVALYTSDCGTDGDVWQKFENEWLEGID